MMSRFLTSLFTSQSRRQTTGFLLFVLLLSATTTPAEANIRLCGQRLTRALFSLCKNQICGATGFSPVKRSSLATMPLLEAHQSVKRSGVATQCCVNKCSYSYLKSYCCID